MSPGEKAFCDMRVAKAVQAILTVLGRRGRYAAARALAAGGGRSWNLRELARAGGVDPVTAGRAVRDLEALAAVEILRPGRDLSVRWRPGSVAAQTLAAVDVPDLPGMTAAAFATAFPAPRGAVLVLWSRNGDDPADPRTPTRIAVVGGDEEAALEAIGPALDAVRAAGLPAPDVTTLPRAMLEQDDPDAEAVRAGTRLAGPGAGQPKRAARPR